MATDQIVSAKDVLRAIEELNLKNLIRIIRDLESLEPDLMEHLFEETTSIHATNVRYGLDSRVAQVVHCRMQSLGVVMILSLRQAYRRLLNDGDEPVDPDLPPDDSASKGDA